MGNFSSCYEMEDDEHHDVFDYLINIIQVYKIHKKFLLNFLSLQKGPTFLNQHEFLRRFANLEVLLGIKIIASR